MNVLSCFDGMSCGQIALNRAGIKYNNYFASEIKKHAIETTQLNYPKTIQLGDVTKIKGSDLPKIDLLIGGSPCQDFSQANSKKLGLKGTKSSLFFEYKRLLDELNPKYFLLENVIMDKYSRDFISNILGVYPVRINSQLVTGAFRDRLYWTNGGAQREDLFGQNRVIDQPVDKRIMLQDILESGFVDILKARSLNTHDGISEKSQDKFWKRYCTTGMCTAVFLSEDLDWTKGIRHFSQLELERLQTIPEGYTSHLTKPKAWDLIGDGWTVDIIVHILNHLQF